MEQELTEKYLLVSRCWNNHTLAVSEKMTNGRAIRDLQDVVARSHNWRLKRRANDLLGRIIFDQEEPDYLKGSVKN